MSFQLRELESNVRSYCRSFAATFDTARGETLFDASGQPYLDFLSACGSLNYGHNHPDLKAAVLEHVARDGLCMSLDMHSSAKDKFLERFEHSILAPRELEYRLQFPGPTGTNAIEAAIKLARKVTGRTNIIAFTNGFHGCSLGALALTGNHHHRGAAGPLLTNVTRMPYDGYFGQDVDTSVYLEKYLCDPSSGCDKPAAIVFETVQGKGGLNTATPHWALRVQDIAREHGALLIVDDIQAGCGRTGSFFSFEPLGIEPDIVCLAKSISGIGLPMSLVLFKPQFDQWKPGEHNGTFRGNNYAFVTAAKSLQLFWQGNAFQKRLAEIGEITRQRLDSIAYRFGFRTKGRGMMMGLDLSGNGLAQKVQAECIANRMIIELCGPQDEVLKLLPPLTISDVSLNRGLDIIEAAVSTHAVDDSLHQLKSA